VSLRTHVSDTEYIFFCRDASEGFFFWEDTASVVNLIQIFWCKCPHLQGSVGTGSTLEGEDTALPDVKYQKHGILW